MFFRQQTNSLSDTELVTLYKSSEDLTLVSELFGRYTSMIYGVCVKYLKDRDDAKDAVMHIFEKLPATLKNHEVNNFKSWLYVITKNHCLMHLRSQKNKRTEELDPSLVENDVVLHQEDEPELENDLSRLENCIKTLADEQQKCVRLFYLQEECYKDIAAKTGFDLNQVKSYIQNGKRNLKICMEK